jgi:metal-dependent hydrolase (beta-lactamase superfamily II)
MTKHEQHAQQANEEPLTYPVIAATHWEHMGGMQMYIRDTPHKVKVGGKFVPKRGFADWEYTEDRSLALPLSRYWWRRFRADMWHCGHCAHWTDARRPR